MFCEFCEGRGWTGWVNDEMGEYSFDPCERNPHKLPSPEVF